MLDIKQLKISFLNMKINVLINLVEIIKSNLRLYQDETVLDENYILNF